MSTGPDHDLGLTEKRTGLGAASDGGCCGGDGAAGCGSGGCGGMCGTQSSGGCGSAGGCACQSAPAPTVRADSVIGAPRVSGSTRVSSVVGVTGMTRGRCIATVMNALERIRGVESVDVDLHADGVSVVTVQSRAALDAEAVRAAIDDAGYALVGEPISAG